ncbi:MAG: S8 family serine peptidase [Gemmatimonadales bacterium]|nr:S8 family serine peptidase [Gemmatimonadales bacterium]
MARFLRSYLPDSTIGIFVVVLAGCAEQPEQVITPSLAVQNAVPRSGASSGVLGRELRQAGDRKDTRWQRMSDTVLAERVRSVGGRVIVGFKDSSQTDGVDNAGNVLAPRSIHALGVAQLRALGADITYEFQRIPAVAARIPAEAVYELRRNPIVDYIDPTSSGQWHAQVTPWGISHIGATASWGLSTGSGVKVIVLDSGHDSTLSDIVVPVGFRCTGGSPIFDSRGHGTHVMGIVGAVHNSIGVVGVAFDAAIWSANILDGSGLPDANEVACAIDVASVNGIFAVNMSFSVDTSTSVTDAINDGYNAGMLFVAAAGNTHGGGVVYPASLTNVIAVTAIDSTNSRPSFTALGSTIELAAPGVNVLSNSLPSGSMCTQGGVTGTCSGTSMAAPHVAGAAVLLKARYPGWTNTAIRNRLTGTATDLGTSGHDNTFGYGLVNVEKALKMQAAVNGPSFVWSGYTETWGVSISGGQASYSYQWYINGSSVGTSSTLNHTPGSSNFWVKVVVSDALSFATSDSLYVESSSCTPPDIIC